LQIENVQENHDVRRGQKGIAVNVGIGRWATAAIQKDAVQKGGNVGQAQNAIAI
jgi:hypothetical protein